MGWRPYRSFDTSDSRRLQVAAAQAVKRRSIDIASALVSGGGAAWLLAALHPTARVCLIFGWPTRSVSSPTTAMCEVLADPLADDQVRVRWRTAFHAMGYLLAEEGLVTSANLTPAGLGLGRSP